MARKNPQRTTLSGKIIDLYYEWFRERNDGIPPHINGVEGKAAKELSSYLLSIASAKDPEADGDTQVEQAIKMMEYILKNWNRVDPFLQRQVKLAQISSNITNIIHGFKRGTAATKKPTGGEVDNRSAFQKIDGHYI